MQETRYNNFLCHFRPAQNLHYDERMIAYYGRNGCKQFIRGKLIRFEERKQVFKIFQNNAE